MRSAFLLSLCSVLLLRTVAKARERVALRASSPDVHKQHRNLQLMLAPDEKMILEPEAPVPPVSKWFKALGNSCDYSGLLGALTMAGFPNPSTTLLQLGIDAAYVESVCLKAYKLSGFLPFREVFDENEYMYVKEFFDGNEEPNEERETRINDFHVPKEVLQDREIGLRINSIFKTWAPYRGIEFPEEQVVNFRDCALNSVMCCYAQDRLANDDDNNGNCNTPYDFNCVDKDPADNTDICLVDMERAPESNRVDGGFGVFEGNVEGSTHCHGFAWAENAFDFSSVYRGNNLFYVAPYDHLYTRGYVRNIDGAPMCGCLEQMPIVSRSDCTQMDVKQLVKWYYNPGTSTKPDYLAARIVHLKIDYRPCDGINGNQNDLLEHIRLLAQQGKVPSTKLPAVQSTLVEDCAKPIAEFLQSKNIKKKPLKETFAVADEYKSLRQRSPLERITFRSPLVSRSNLRVYATVAKLADGQGDVGFGATPEGVHPAAMWVFKEVSFCSGGQSDKVCFAIENESSGRLLYATVGENGQYGVGAAAPSESYGEDQVWYLESSGGSQDFWVVNSFSGRALYAEATDGQNENVVGADSVHENSVDYKWALENVPELAGGDATGTEEEAPPTVGVAPAPPTVKTLPAKPPVASPSLREAPRSSSLGRESVIP